MRPWAIVCCSALILLGGPLAGVWLAGKPVAPYLELPPRPPSVEVPGFSWPVFVAMVVFVVAAVAPFVLRFMHASSSDNPGRPARNPLPGWGWAALVLLGASWLLAWSRFEWFEPFQPHTFTPMWLGYIGVVNALIVRRKGNSLLTRQPARYALLFPLSALFWWFFEYLNRFVGNWYYVGVREFGPIEYTLLASLAFSTVLPAVTSTAELTGTFSRVHHAFGHWHRVELRHTGVLALAVLALTALSLIGLAVFPQYLYPLVWISPALVVISLQTLGTRATVFAPLGHGDWRELVSYSTAAIVCGFFWEMWNAGSLAHWEYSVPYVERFHLFEMPLLGYAGYLPFGIECAAVSRLVLDSESVRGG